MARRPERDEVRMTTTAMPMSPSTAPPPRFLLATAQGTVQLHALPAEGEAILGRGAEGQVVLDYSSISRQHARLRLGAICTLTDLGSRNGTQLRGERLREGDE